VPRAALLLAALLAGLAGHLGGELVHGAGFFSAPFTLGEPAAAPEPVPVPAAPSAGARVDFATQVLPILQARCHECHGAAKVRGKLRLDAREQLFDPAREAEWVVRPGDPDGSELLRRVSLPAGDEDAMPAKGDPLTPEQVALLRAWIAQGAVWPE
jgi:mono/diheme cytochrome c family protein